MQVKIATVLVLQARMKTPVTTKNSSCTMISTEIPGQMNYLIQNFVSLVMILGKSPSLILFLNRSMSPLLRLPSSGVTCWSLAVT